MYGGSGYLSERLNLKRLDEVACAGGGSGGVRWRGGHSMILAKGNLRNRSTQSSVLSNYNAGKRCYLSSAMDYRAGTHGRYSCQTNKP